MIKLLFLFILCFSASVSFAQEIDFYIQPNGTFLSYKNDKDYIVLECPDKTKDELYTNILTTATKLYNSPKNVISKVDGEIISINGVRMNCISVKGGLGLIALFSIKYRLNFEFKDGKIKINAPHIMRCFHDGMEDVPFYKWLEVHGIYKNGFLNPRGKKTLDDFDNTINDIILSLVSGVNKDQEDW